MLGPTQLRACRAVIQSITLVSLLSVPTVVSAQAFGSADIQRGHDMLKSVINAVKQNYYDPKFGGLDLDTLFTEADARLKTAQSYGDIYITIGEVLLKLRDSHTVFIPPLSSTRVEYGWRMQIYGDRCFIVAVKPGTDAEVKGLKPGDEVMQVFGVRPTRANIWIINYENNFLRHYSEVGMIVRNAAGDTHELHVAAEVRQERQMFDLGRMGAGERYELIRRQQTMNSFNPDLTYDAGEQLFIWKMREFGDERVVDDIMSKAKRSKAVILDLRGNGGGSLPTLQHLLGIFFDHDLKVGDIKLRKESKPLISKSEPKNNFKGRLIVLIDSKSASAAELLARVVQLEKRGIVIGDRSTGAVMRARYIPLKSGLELIMTYGVLVTDSDIILTDGKSLEGTGVTPDELIIPDAADLAGQLDPVLGHAAALTGVILTPQKAGKLFPIDWRQYGFPSK